MARTWKKKHTEPRNRHCKTILRNRQVTAQIVPKGKQRKANASDAPNPRLLLLILLLIPSPFFMDPLYPKKGAFYKSFLGVWAASFLISASYLSANV